jgi:origin recognition complex subunit 3
MTAFLFLCSPHLPEFPVVLILGLATSVGAIHRSLPRSAASLLCIEQFHAQHPTKTLSQIITEVGCIKKCTC